MREIKFRAWNGSKLIKLDALMLPLDDGDMPVMQYIGLRDKNGVEIYEGDIIASWMWEGRETDEAAVYLVKWFDKNEAEFIEVGTSTNYPNLAPAVGLGFSKIRGEFDHKDLKLCYFADRFEIIGNIYENPELLVTN